MAGGFYRGIVEGMSCAVLTIDIEGRILTINAPARQVLEIGDEPVYGRLCGEVLAEHPRLLEILHEVFSCATLPSRAELEIRSRDDRPKTIGFSISRIRGRDGQDLGMAMFFKDLTQVEQQAEHERLRDRLAALGGMAAQMAHEIRNPVASISVTTQLVRRRLEAAGENTDAVDRIARDITRIERTIADCLEYVRPLSPTITRASLCELLKDSVAQARERAGASRVLVDLECDPGLRDVPCDGPRLREVFSNLIINAVEAVGEKEARIIIRARAVPSGDRREMGGPSWQGPVSGGDAGARGEGNGSDRDLTAVISISDNGPGIPADVLDRIFYPYFTTKTKGTGIGLAMARKIVEAHHGVIDVTSGAGEGATFTIRLPLGPQDDGRPLAAPALASRV